MCIAAPGKVASINGREAQVEYPGIGPRKAMVGQPGVNVGDWVTVQMGIITQVIPSEQAKDLEKSWQERESS